MVTKLVTPIMTGFRIDTINRYNYQTNEIDEDVLEDHLDFKCTCGEPILNTSTTPLANYCSACGCKFNWKPLSVKGILYAHKFFVPKRLGCTETNKEVIQFHFTKAIGKHLVKSKHYQKQWVQTLNNLIHRNEIRLKFRFTKYVDMDDTKIYEGDTVCFRNSYYYDIYYDEELQCFYTTVYTDFDNLNMFGSNEMKVVSSRRRKELYK